MREVLDPRFGFLAVGNVLHNAEDTFRRAVARFALPNLMPACYRWELQPDSGTLIECGASVPLYGQSGGGVEVRFPKDTNNRCPIADPVILPPL